MASHHYHARPSHGAEVVIKNHGRIVIIIVLLFFCYNCFWPRKINSWLLQDFIIIIARIADESFFDGTDTAFSLLLPIGSWNQSKTANHFLRVAKCQGYWGYICVKNFASWGKKFGRTCKFAISSLFWKDLCYLLCKN